MALKQISPGDRMAQRIAAVRKRMNRELDEILREYLATAEPVSRPTGPNRVVDPLARDGKPSRRRASR